MELLIHALLRKFLCRDSGCGGLAVTWPSVFTRSLPVVYILTLPSERRVVWAPGGKGYQQTLLAEE